MKKSLGFAAIIIGLSVTYFLLLSKKEQNRSELIIYSYSSFANSWGAGPQLVRKFEETHKIKVLLNDIGDARTLLQRLELERGAPRADLIIGLDQLVIEEAQKKFKWEKIKTSDVIFSKKFPEKKVLFDQFVPFDWAPMTFIYREGEVPPPRTFVELQAMNYQKKLILYDPRSSSPGYIFVDWLIRSMGLDQTKKYLEELKPNILTVTASWSSGYGLFQKKQAGLVFSYVTSPIYHWLKEKDYTYKASPFADPVPYHIEYGAVPSTCNRCDLAKEFLNFLLEPESQKLIMNSNFMYPVIEGIVEGTEFEKLPELQIIPLMQAPGKSAVIEAWKMFGP